MKIIILIYSKQLRCGQHDQHWMKTIHQFLKWHFLKLLAVIMLDDENQEIDHKSINEGDKTEGGVSN